MDSKSSKTSERQRLMLTLSDKVNVKTTDKFVALSNISMYYT